MRARMSLMPPAGNGTMNFMGLLGKAVSAAANSGSAATASAASRPSAILRFMAFPLPRRNLFRFDAGLLDDLGVLVAFRSRERGELLGRADPHIGAGVAELPLHLGRSQDLVDLGIEP